MPVYAKGGKVVCFFRSTQKFKEGYMTLGFNDSARLDEGSVWPISYVITRLSGADEAKVAALIKKAVR